MVTRPTAELVAEMRAHMSDPFPESVEKGADYGEVDAVMVGADIYGWASSVRDGASLAPIDRARFLQTADELARSLSAFPDDARPYYERVLLIARLALDQG